MSLHNYTAFQLKIFDSSMPPFDASTLPQKKHGSVRHGPGSPQLSAATAGSSTDGESKGKVLGVDTGPTLEEQQRRSQTALVTRDWEILAWYSIAGREVGFQSHFFSLSYFYMDIHISPFAFCQWTFVSNATFWQSEIYIY